MRTDSISRLTLGELDPEGLRALVDHGEDLLVEPKREPPKPPGFGAAVASFANMLGGWILLGVADDKTIVGYEPPPRADVQSYLGELLRREVDPLPPFVAESRELDGKRIVPLQVFESADSPHVVRGTGAIYVRSSKGKEPVDDHRTIFELAQRGEEAEARARTRLSGLPVVRQMSGVTAIRDHPDASTIWTLASEPPARTSPPPP